MNALAFPSYVSVLALVGVVAIVAVLYWLKPPPRKVIVPSSLVWDRVLRESHPTPDRLCWWLSLLLAALIATAMAIAVVPLRQADSAATASKFILVLDDSPTMATRTTDGATRWDHAVAKARAAIEARSAGTQVWLADTMRKIATPAFRDREDALAQLASLRVSYGFAPVVPLPEQPSGIETVVITDGVSIGPLPAQVRPESVFESVENAGITAFEVRALPADPNRAVAYVEMANASGVDKGIELAIVGVGGKRVTRILAIPAHEARSELVDLADFDGGPVRASIAMPGDGLATDDVAYSVLPMRRVMRVALVTDGNDFLEKSLRTQPRVKLTVVSPSRFVDDLDVDAIVFDRFAPNIRPRVPALLFRPTHAGWLPPSGKIMANPSVVAWNAAHPLLENISLLDLNVDRAAVFDLKNGGENASMLARGPGASPLIIAHEDGARWIAFSFALDESNFPLHTGFPIFLGNALSWMVGEQEVMVRGLGAIEVPVPGARVVAADGKELPVQSIPGGSMFEVDTPGLFTVVSAHQRLRVAANLLDRRITDVNNSRLASVKPDADRPVDAARSFAFDSWFALLLAAALLLLFEWWAWNRRITV